MLVFLSQWLYGPSLGLPGSSLGLGGASVLGRRVLGHGDCGSSQEEREFGEHHRVCFLVAKRLTRMISPKRDNGPITNALYQEKSRDEAVTLPWYPCYRRAKTRRLIVRDVGIKTTCTANLFLDCSAISPSPADVPRPRNSLRSLPEAGVAACPGRERTHCHRQGL